MTHRRLPEAMPRRRTALTAWIGLLVILGATTSTANGQEDEPEAGEGWIQLELRATPGPHDESPHVSLLLVLNTTVEGDPEHREVRAPLPQSAQLEGFTPLGDDVSEAETRAEEQNGTRWAVAEWDRDGPLPGSDLTMRLDAHMDIDPGQEIHVNWTHLPTLLSVRIYLPSTITPVVDPEYAIKREASTGGLVGWNLTAPPRGNLTLQLHPLEPGPDPSLAAPPPAWGAPAVIIALVLVSGGFWFLGKKLEARKGKRHNRP